MSNWEIEFERQREREHTDLPEEEDPNMLHEGDPCPECGKPIRVSSMGPGHYEPWCPNDPCEWGR